MRFLYNLIMLLLLPVYCLRMLLLAIRDPGYRHCWRQRLGLVAQNATAAGSIWIHAVSVGEVEAALGIVRQLHQQYPERTIIVSTVTPTGRQIVTRKLPDDIVHVYLPYDLPFMVSRFMDGIKPGIAVVLETEIWPNLFAICRKRHIPLLLVNARLSPTSFRRYHWVKGLVADTLSCVDHVIAQSQVDSDRFKNLGCDGIKVSIAGNLKFDVNVDSQLAARARELRAQYFNNSPVWIAASTHEGEEEQILNAHGILGEVIPGCRLILAPRHPHRFSIVAEMCRNKGFTVTNHSQSSTVVEDEGVYLLDTLGELQMFYYCADVAFIGGSLVPVGGHNVLEAVAAGAAVVTGVHTENFHEIMRLMKAANGLLVVENERELCETVSNLMLDYHYRSNLRERASALLAENRGGTQFTLDIISNRLGPAVCAAGDF